MILAETPKERQTLLFSATMPQGISEIARKYMNSPEEVSLGKRNSGADNVSHEYYMVHAKDRYLALKRIVDINPSVYGIVFCRTRIETKEVADKLMQDGYNADALHGDLSQAQRDYVMNRFRIKNLQILVATDVAARGLDVHDLTHVINYNLPDDPEIYVHRSGRTGRAGKTGISLSLVHLREKHILQQIERKVKKSFKSLKIPTGSEICGKQLFNWVSKLENVITDHQEIEKFLQRRHHGHDGESADRIGLPGQRLPDRGTGAIVDHDHDKFALLDRHIVGDHAMRRARHLNCYRHRPSPAY